MNEIFEIRETITISNDEIAEAKGVDDVVRYARGIKVIDEQSYKGALTFAKEMKERARQIKNKFEDQKKKAHELHKSTMALIAELASPLEDAAKIASNTAYQYQKAEEARQRAEQLAKIEAERKRIEEENLRLAEQLVFEGKPEEAEKVIDQQIIVPVEQIKKPEGVSGVSHRENWKIEILDKKLFFDWVFKEKKFQYISVNESELNKLAKAVRGDMKIPGVRPVDVGTTAFRS